MEATYQVKGMTCGGCAGSVTRAIQRISADLEVVVSHAEGTATVRGEHDPAAVRAAVEAAGFEFVGRAT